MKRKTIISFILSILVLFCGCTNVNEEVNNAELEISILDVGKADCSIIKIKDRIILIDTGLDENGDDIVNRLKSQGIDMIDYLILTHMDKDHIGGADKVINNIKINNLITADYEKDSKQYAEYLKSIQDNNLEPVKLRENLKVNIYGAEINIYPAEKEYYDQSNDYSIITDITYGQYNFLFAGDAEDERLAEFLNSNHKKYTLVKMPHHGRYDGLTKEFIQSTAPKYSVITCSQDENADEKTLKALNNNKSEVFITYDGDVKIKCNHNQIQVKQ